MQLDLFQRWLNSQSLLGAGSLQGYPSVTSVLALAMLIILLLFYRDRNSSIYVFQKNSLVGENIPVTSLSSQRLMALNFVKQKAVKKIETLSNRKHFKLRVKHL